MSSRRSKKAASLGFKADLRAGLKELSRQTSTEHKVVVFIFIALGIVLRAMLIGRPISIPEAAPYMEFATLPLGELISDYSLPSNHVFHTLLTRISTGIFGVGVVQLRMPAFLAGVLCMPFFYLFVRAMFNRYIALITLAIVACSGPLISVGTQALGYSVCWLFFTASLLLGRHFVKSNDQTSAMLIALFNALGVWTMPAYAYAALAVFIWILIALTMNYTHSIRERVGRWVLAFIVFVILSFLFYTPVLQEHGFDQLTNSHVHPRLEWADFDLRHTDMAFNLWAFAVDGTSSWIALFGFFGLLYAAFVSSKLRAMLIAIFFAGVTLGLMMRRMEPPQVWAYSLFIFHLSTGIAVFYLLKLLQEKVYPNWGKRARTVVASFVLALAFALPGMKYAWRRSTGLPEVDRTVEMLQTTMRPGDKFFVQHPWDAPMHFALRAAHGDETMLTGPVADGAAVMVAIGEQHEQTVEGVLRHNGQDPARWPGMHMVQDWPGLKIFAAP